MQLNEQQRAALAQYRANKSKVSKTESALTGAADVASFGFGDEVLAGLSAAGAKTLDVLGVDQLLGGEVDKDIGELYDVALEKRRDEIKKAQQDNPLSYIGGGVGGALLTGGVGAGTKAGTAIANSLRTGGTAARIGKGAAVGAASGGAYGFGTGEGEGRLESAGEGALYGAAFGGAIPAAGAAIKSTVKGGKSAASGLKARGVEQLDEALASIRENAKASYKAMRDANVTLNKVESSNVLSQLNSALKASGPLNKKIHGKTISVMKDLRKLGQKGKLDLEELEQYRQLFGDMAGDFNNRPNARTARILKGALDDALDGLDDSAFNAGGKDAIDALKAGRAEYAKGRKFEMIADIVKKSDGDANYVKRELTKIVNNPKKNRGFTAQEKAALEEAANLSGGEAVLKILGKFGFDPARLGSGVGAIFGSSGGAVLGGATGATLVPAVGTGARYLQKGVQRGKTENLLKAIEGTAAPTTKAISAPPVQGVIGRGANLSVRNPASPIAASQTGGTTAPAAITASGVSATSGGLSGEQMAALEQYRASKQQAQQATAAPSLMQFVKKHEGFRSKPYQDSAGVWTIGYGTTRIGGKPVGPNTAPITEAQAQRIAQQDLGKFEKKIAPAIKAAITPNQKAAIMSLAYNIGPGAFRSSTLLKKLNAGDLQGAANEFMKWNKITKNGKKVELAGLTKRREEERQLFLS